jgi:CheY-like chemotaxis protein
VTTGSFAREGGSDLQTVLLVDAKVLSRLALADYLRECGYRVIEAASPEEAMMVLKAPELKVDILLSDVAS